MLDNPLKASASAVAMVQHSEGLRLDAYPDNPVAMGYGTHRAWFKIGDSCTIEQAKAWLLEDIADRETLLNAHFKGSMSQGAFDAMISWSYTFNRELITSTLLADYNIGRKEAAWNELPEWVHEKDPRTGQMIVSPGLQRRRWTEQAMWLGQDWLEYQQHNYPALVYVGG